VYQGDYKISKLAAAVQLIWRALARLPSGGSVLPRGGAISRFETVNGLSTQDIKIADMGNTGALAYAESDSGRVVIHKELLNTGRMESMMRKN
jgi:hypothetical protein